MADICGARKPGFEDGPAIGRNRIPCIRSECVVANRISFEACGAGDHSDRDASVVVGMKKRAPW